MRCSSLPLASKCRGSHHLTKGFGSAQSRCGTAFHEAARAKVLQLQFDVESLKTRYGLTDAEMKDINYSIYNIQIQIPKDAMVLADDKQLTGLGGRLTGTPDLGIVHDGVLTVVDWKGGFSDQEAPETNNQLIGYALMILEELERLGITVHTIHLMIVMPKLNQVKAYTYTLEKLMARKADLIRIIDEAELGKGEFTTGPWCNSCFKNMECPAFAGQVQMLANYIAPAAPEAIINVDQALKILLPLSKAAATVSRKIEALAKAWVDKNGPLELGAGQTYAKVIGEKKEVNAQKAFETLKEFFQEQDIWDKTVSVSMTGVSDLAKETKLGLSAIVKNRMVETGAITTKIAVTYRIIKGGDNAGQIE